MKTRLVRSMLASALAVTALSGCEGLLDDGDQEQGRQFRMATARWESLDIRDYTFTLSLACVCGDPDDLRDIVVTVENGVVVSRVYDDGGDPAPEEIFGAYDTVEELFDVVAEGISQDADVLNVGYHTTYGMPVVYQVDPSKAVSDDYILFEMLDFSLDVEE